MNKYKERRIYVPPYTIQKYTFTYKKFKEKI